MRKLKLQMQEHAFAQKMVGLPKVVFSKTLPHIEGKNVRVENGDLVDAVKQLKSRPGKNIIVYGGGTLRASPLQTRPTGALKPFFHPGGGWGGGGVGQRETPPQAGGRTH